MPVAEVIVAVSWATLVVAWVIAPVVTRTARATARAAVGLPALALAVAAVLLATLPRSAPPSTSPRLAAAALAPVGAAIAVWARLVLGRNWAAPMKRRHDTELVTRGPYAHVRHPIYTGLLAAVLATCLVGGPRLIPNFVLVFAIFFVAARREEADMARRFPDAYPGYRRRTKMLVPFIL